VLLVSGPALAADYFLTLGGGYEPEGNQASLEANVIFFQNLLKQTSPQPRWQEVYFADGLDPAADLQVTAPKTKQSELVTLLVSIHSRVAEQEVEYRNNRVPNVNGALKPEHIRLALERVTAMLQPTDRLFIYVTSHGGSADAKEPYNTNISCWGSDNISVKQFSAWLDALPPKTPVVLVMAQCYCGGFAHAIFKNADAASGPAERLRVGFFAQQHDLPAAGCRPDIEDDEEFSSYFWGAMTGQTRTGEKLPSCDANHDGLVSLAEAYAEVLVASSTIDIPLRTSDELLRRYSRIPEHKYRKLSVPKKEDEPEKIETDETDAKLVRMSGKLSELLVDASPEKLWIVTELAKQLELPLDHDVQEVFAGFKSQQAETRRQQAQSRPGRGRRGNSGRRELIAEIEKEWPELADRRKWRESSLLKGDTCDRIAADIKALPSYAKFDEARKAREEASKAALVSELKEVKFRRLGTTLEGIVLEKNLPQVAEASIIARFKEMLNLENSTLSLPKQANR
jgi:hypothetical protein